MKKLKNVGLLTPGWPGQNTPNGIATAVYNLALGLKEIGVEPIILTSNIDGPCPSDITVVEVQTPPWRWHERLRAKLGAKFVSQDYVARNIANAVNEAVQKHDLGAVIMEETYGWARIVKAKVSIPVFVALHGPNIIHKELTPGKISQTDVLRDAREEKGFEAATGLMSPSQDVLDRVVKVSPLPQTPKVVLVNTLPSDANAPLAVEGSGRDILFIGRFDNHKGGDVMIKAFAQLIKSHPTARMTFVGPDRGVLLEDGSKLDIQTALAALPDNVRDRLTYFGPANRDEVMQLRATHPIAVIASRYENLNYTLLEAMGAGQAIVCTNVGGPGEVLIDGKTALMVPPEDPAAIALALGHLLDDAKLTKTIGKAAHTQLRADFNPATVAQQTVDFIETEANRVPS